MIYSKHVPAIGVLVFLLSLTACIATKTGAYGVFSDDLKRIIGKPLKEAYVFGIGNLSEKAPNEVKDLGNNNQQWIYYFQHNKWNNNEACTVFIEINIENKVIINTSYIGVGCWRPY
jgi:hypothetical protein